MKRVKRFLSVLLTLCMLMGMLPSTAFAVDHSMPFADVENTDWFYDAVEYVYDNGIMSGTGDTTFSPDIATTRSMIVTILHRMEGTPSANGEGFADVPAGQWYTNAISWASANGVVSGYGNGMFGPNDPITREQMAAILYRYVQYKEYDHAATGDVSAFADFSQTSDYAVEALNWATGEGLISGVGNNMLDPTGSATRAQAAMILMRFCEQVISTDTPASDTYTVTFEYNYGDKGVYQIAEVNDGDTVDSPENPSRSGYSFNGWYTKATGGEKFDFTTVISTSLTLYAQWERIYNSGNSTGGSVGDNDDTQTDNNKKENQIVLFDLNFPGSGTRLSQSVVYGEHIIPPADPIRDGYQFDGWYTATDPNVPFDFNSEITTSMVLYAKWSIQDSDSDGASNAWETAHNYDPNNYDLMFSVTQTAPDDLITASVNVELKGSQVETLTVIPLDAPGYFDESIPGYLGPAFNFDVDGYFDEATISFTFQQELLLDPYTAQPTIY